MPFGVELPDNLGEKPSTEVEERNTLETSDESGESPEKTSNETAKAQEIQELLDLDKQERVRFDGREWSVKELRNAYLMHGDYTRKTQELAETRKYAENFAADLQTVLRQPELLSELAKIYPAEYVRRAEALLSELKNGNGSTQNASASQQESPQKPNLPPEFQEILSWKKQVEQERHEERVQATQRELDSLFDKYGKTYDLANQKAVNNAAIALVEAGHKLTPQALEKLFKQEHEENKARFEKLYSSKVQAQKQAGLKARDAGPGGSAPGASPKVARTMREARDQWLKDLEASK